MIGIIFATEQEAGPLQQLNLPPNVVVKISGIGLEAARIAAEELLESGVSTIINGGVCAGLHHRVKRGEVYRISHVITEELKAAVNIGFGIGLKKLVSVETPLYQKERKRELSKQYDLVDMEGYAIARVCEKNNVPCILIKGVTDFGDMNAKHDIKIYMESVSKTIAEGVIYVLDGLEKKYSNQKTNVKKSSLISRLGSFTKIEHIIFSLPLLFAGAWLGSDKIPTFEKLFLISLAGLGARTFGMALNRIFDRHIDKNNPRTSSRELAAGTLNLKQGYLVSFIGLIFYFLSCFYLGPIAWSLSLLPIIPLIIYSFLKRFTALCHFGIGVVLACAPLCAYIAVSNTVVFNPQIILFSLFTFLWISGFDIIYSLMDEEYDRLNNIHSMSVLLGKRGAQIVALLIHIIAFSLLVLLWMSIGGVVSFIFLILAALSFGAAYIQTIPVNIRFFPISVIAGISSALVILFGGI